MYKNKIYKINFRVSALAVLQHIDERALTRVLRLYGGLTSAPKIARSLMQARWVTR